MDLLSRPQPIEARHLGRNEHAAGHRGHGGDGVARRPRSGAAAQARRPGAR